MRCTLLLAILLPTLLAPVAWAEQSSYPPVIEQLVKNRGIKIVSEFEAPGGITAYAAQYQGHDLVFYLTPDKQYTIVGHMLDAKGDDLTAQQIDAQITGPALAGAWSKLEKSAWVAEGAKQPKRIIYEFTDPNCPFCHLFWLANQPYLKEGLQVRHVLVGIITPSSKYRAAAILEAADPSAAMTKNERDYNTKGPEDKAGGVAPLSNPKPATLAKLSANKKLMQSLGVTGTPGIFYKDANGKVKRIVGLPPLSKLGTIYGLPPQPVTNPALQRFK